MNSDTSSNETATGDQSGDQAAPGDTISGGVAANRPARTPWAPADILETREDDELHFRSPKRNDGAAVRQLVEDSGGLEPNTCYAYLLLCTHFADTCLVAERGGELVGFVAAYRPPSRPESIFVWQIGISPDARGEGLAKRLLQHLVSLPACRDAIHLEATVAPSNLASQRLFKGFARDRGVDCQVGPGFHRHDFGPLVHEAEELFRIGPLRRMG